MENYRSNGKVSDTFFGDNDRNKGDNSELDESSDAQAGAWQNKTQFLLTVVGYSVGLGNIWRFPYLCQKNGGGAFLIPFLIMVIIQGAPLLLIELGIGQKLRSGSLHAWKKIHPGFGGIGLASTVASFLVALYYNVIICWCIFYLFNSLRTTLPWASCPVDQSIVDMNGTIDNQVVPECGKSSETSYFWYRTALDITASIDEFDGIRWSMAGCLLLAWVIVYFIIMRGIQSSGKIVYFTALFPYLVLTIFFIRGVTLEGAWAGILHMYTPKIHMLLEPSVWLAAATQVFFSFGLGFGSLVAFGSYNKPKNNCVKDVIFITFTNAFTAIYASVVIFSVLGFKATAIHNRCLAQNKLEMNALNPMNSAVYDEEVIKYLRNELGDVLKEQEPFRSCSLEEELDSVAAGTGLAFVVFTQAILELPFSPFWSIIFFLMLISLGLGSQIGTTECIVNTIFASPYFSRFRKEVLTAILCGFSFIIGLIFVTGAGEYWVALFDGYASTICLIVIALLETISVIYVYGSRRFSEDIEHMTGYYPGPFWQICWKCLGPLSLIILLIGSVWDTVTRTPSYKAWDNKAGAVYDREFPGWTMGIALALMSLGIIPLILVCTTNFISSRRSRSASTGMRKVDTSASTVPLKNIVIS